MLDEGVASVGMGRAPGLVAVLAAGAITLGACTSSGTDENPAAPANQLAWAQEQDFASYNNNTADQNQAANVVVLNQVQRGFWYFDPQGRVVPDTEFGRYAKTSDNPLTVRYTINDKAVWSDGVPVECSDFVLAWAANSGRFPTGQKDAEGQPVTVFSSATTTGYEDIAGRPRCAKGDKSVTVTYARTFADWAALFGSTSFMPAHIVARQSGVTDLIAAVDAALADPSRIADLKPAGDFYNTGWTLTPGRLKKDLMPSAGPYLIDAWQAGQSVTLKANPRWWGPPAKTPTVVIRIIPGEAQAQALQNDEIQMMDPQPQTELVSQLKALGDQIRYSSHQQLFWEHLDFNFRTGNVFTDRAVREAFAKCVPRQQIVDNLVKPVNPDAVVLQSRMLLPFQQGYAEMVRAAYPGGYDTVDIAAAKKLLGGRRGITVKIGYPVPNQRRSNTVQLIRASCSQAGFDVQDDGAGDFFSKGLSAGSWDVALYGWIGSSIVTAGSSIYITNGGNNEQKYSNAKVDADTKALGTTLDGATKLQLQERIDKQLWADLATIPLFAHPAVLATAKDVTGVEYNSSQSDLSWNMQNWARG